MVDVVLRREAAAEVGVALLRHDGRHARAIDGDLVLEAETAPSIGRVEVRGRVVVEAHVVADFVNPCVGLRIIEQHRGEMVRRILSAALDFVERVETRKTAESATVRRRADDNVRAVAVAKLQHVRVFASKPFALAEDFLERPARAIDRMDADHAEPEVRVHIGRAKNLVHLRRRLGGIDFERARAVPGALVRFDILLAGRVIDEEKIDCFEVRVRLALWHGTLRDAGNLRLPVRYDGAVRVIVVIDRAIEPRHVVKAREILVFLVRLGWLLAPAEVLHFQPLEHIVRESERRTADGKLGRRVAAEPERP